MPNASLSASCEVQSLDDRLNLIAQSIVYEYAWQAYEIHGSVVRLHQTDDPRLILLEFGIWHIDPDKVPGPRWA